MNPAIIIKEEPLRPQATVPEVSQIRSNLRSQY